MSLHPTCAICDDTGWQMLHCDGTACPMTDRPHYAHRYVKRCICWLIKTGKAAA